MPRAARLWLGLLALALAAPARAAGQEILLRAMDLEEVGAWNEAGALYRQVLVDEPTNAAALLGLERVYVQPAQRDTVLAYAARAIAANPAAEAGYAVELRALRAMGRDSAAAAALQRWVKVDSTNAAPWREWARISFRAGRVQDARDAVLLARQRLRAPTALAPEMAQVDVTDGDWSGAAGEWRAAVAAQPVYADAAVFSLRPAPAAAHEAVVRALAAPDGHRTAHDTSDAPPPRSGPATSVTAPDGHRTAHDTSDAPPPRSGPATSVTAEGGAAAPRRVAADLLLAWNEPARAWVQLKGALPAADSERALALRLFAERARSLDGPAAQRAAAEAYDLLASASAAEDASELRIESARAYAAAGDTADARRILGSLSRDTSADGATRSAAAGAMVELLVTEGNPEAAARALAGAGLSGTERERLDRVIARGFIALGVLDRAERAVAADSSLAGDEVRGWVALYRGQLADARRLLRQAGALVGDRARAPQRAETVALLDAVGPDTLPRLGAALLAAARGDSLGASRALVAVARGLPGAAGSGGEAAPALLSWAARFAAAGGDSAGAVALWLEVADRFDSSAAAPAAELALARALAGRGDVKAAVARLEAMILAHPESALVPEARRELDRLRGEVPGGGT